MKHWSRLVRFNAQGHGDKVFLGQPVDPKIDGTLYYILFDTISDTYPVGLALHSGKPVEVWQISGKSALDTNAVVTSSKLQIARLLAPLSQEETYALCHMVLDRF
jgi:hypothetical protein